MKGVTIKVDGTAALMQSIRALTKSRVLVGIPDTTADRQPEPGEAGPINNATIGYLMETGSPAANIPARPHLVPGVESAAPRIVAVYKAGAKAVLDGGDADKAHHTAGLIAQNAVRAKVTEGPFTPLAESTLAKRRAAGFTGTKPLIVSGQYRASLTYVVRPTGG